MAKKKDHLTTNQDQMQVDGTEIAAAGAPVPDRLKKKVYREQLAGLQMQLVRLQEWITGRHLRAVILLEGLGPAGKATTACSIEEGLQRRVCQVVTLDPPDKRVRKQWYFQRYAEHLPAAGKLTIFDGSWYHVPAMERALGLCGEEQYPQFLATCVDFERSLAGSDVTLIKYWFTASEEEQERRFRQHVQELQRQKRLRFMAPEGPCKRNPADVTPANFTPVAQVRAETFTCTAAAPTAWHVIQADDKRQARLDCLGHLLTLIPPDGAGAEAG